MRWLVASTLVLLAGLGLAGRAGAQNMLGAPPPRYAPIYAYLDDAQVGAGGWRRFDDGGVGGALALDWAGYEPPGGDTYGFVLGLAADVSVEQGRTVRGDVRAAPGIGMYFGPVAFILLGGIGLEGRTSYGYGEGRVRIPVADAWAIELIGGVWQLDSGVTEHRTQARVVSSWLGWKTSAALTWRGVFGDVQTLGLEIGVGI